MKHKHNTFAHMQHQLVSISGSQKQRYLNLQTIANIWLSCFSSSPTLNTHTTMSIAILHLCYSLNGSVMTLM